LHYHQRPLILSGDADGVKIDIMQKIEHIGIAVKNLEESNQRFAQLLNTIHYKTEEVPQRRSHDFFF
jgi:hypothetical protein